MTTSQPQDASQPDQPTQAPIAQQAPQGTLSAPLSDLVSPTTPGGWAPPGYAPYPMYIPPPPPYPPYAFAPGYGAYPGAAGYPPVAPGQPASTWAKLSLACGALGFIGAPIVGSILGIVFGHMALGEIHRSNGALDGRSMATVGLVLSYVSLALYLVLFAADIIISFLPLILL